MDTINETAKHFLFPSTIFAQEKRHLVDTILGSCVSVCLFDNYLKIGGINHYMMPFWNGDGLATPKYGNIANEKLYERMISLGSKNFNITAKVFGGANQINNSIGIGEKNITVARLQLEELKIKIVAENVGGAIGRKIWFDTGTGEVIMKFLSKQ